LASANADAAALSDKKGCPKAASSFGFMKLGGALFYGRFC
jgi:hypothetical protein